MRSTLIVLAGILALIPAFFRALNKPLFIADYHYLLEFSYAPIEHFLYQALLLAVFFTLFVFVTQKHVIPKESILVLLASPAVITSLVITDQAISIGILSLITILFWEHDVLFALIALTGVLLIPPAALFAPLVICVLAIRQKRLLAIITTLLLIIILYYTSLPLTIQTGFAELGMLGGISIFIALLAITGTVITWKKQTYPYLLIALFVAIIGTLFYELRYVAVIATAIMGGHAIQILLKREWRLENIKKVSILLVICGLLFTTTATANQAINTPPTHHTQELIQFMQHIDQEAFALSNHHALLLWHDVTLTASRQETFLTSRNIDEVRHLIPPLLILHTEDSVPNLRFLITYTDDFSILFRNEEWEVWAFENT